MPANLTPQYMDAEKRFKQAESVPEKIAALEEMMAEDKRFKARPSNTLPAVHVAVLPIMSTYRFYGTLRPGARLGCYEYRGIARFQPPPFEFYSATSTKYFRRRLDFSDSA